MEILIAVLVFFGIAGWSDTAIANTQKNPEKAGHELTVQNEKLSEDAIFWKNVSDEMAKMFSGIVSQMFQREAELSSKIEQLETDNKALFNLAQMAGPLAIKVQEKEKTIKYLGEDIKYLKRRVKEADILYDYYREKAEGRRQMSVKLSDELYDLQKRLIAAKNESDFKNKLFVGLMLLFFGAVALAVLMRHKLELANKQHEDLKKQIEGAPYLSGPGPSYKGDVPPVI